MQRRKITISTKRNNNEVEQKERKCKVIQTLSILLQLTQDLYHLKVFLEQSDKELLTSSELVLAFSNVSHCTKHNQ